MPGCNNDAQKRLRLENGFEFFEISNGDLKFESLIKIRNSFMQFISNLAPEYCFNNVHIFNLKT